MAEPVQEYTEAIQALKAAEQKAENYAQFIVDAGAKLRNWRRVVFSNVPVSFPLIAHEMSIVGSNWPTAIEIAQAISDYHTAAHAAENAYHRIPAETRAIVTPPNAR